MTDACSNSVCTCASKNVPNGRQNGGFYGGLACAPPPPFVVGKNANGVAFGVCVWRFDVRFQGQTRRAPDATNAALSAAVVCARAHARPQPHAWPRPRAASSWHGDARALVFIPRANPRAVRSSYAPALAMCALEEDRQRATTTTTHTTTTAAAAHTRDRHGDCRFDGPFGAFLLPKCKRRCNTRLSSKYGVFANYAAVVVVFVVVVVSRSLPSSRSRVLITVVGIRLRSMRLCL